ncbi:methyl-accepting chemotaxis protein [Paraburkholderia diazotrophica]|uniref:Type IV pili methyl-accepting chemotaxis transducer N-term n=1 Tax=Paraburkholderia diazotrophica TaxID=667676 RepID=A0A1H7DRG2_9BURK|nr:methyl-accepting chemotaxis protein [Paraburkholderia diazotrophica]SEK03964.1 Type IV pili methyl-accepting chemotaxis transducer N-term [Paraburkholderia diazotrophica]
MNEHTSTQRIEVSAQTIGELINLSGRQRMLSQRIVLHVLLASHGDMAALVVARECLATFATTHAVLVNGNDHLPGVFSDALRQLYFGTRKADERVGRFIALTEQTAAHVEARDDAAQAHVEALVAQATPLLELLQDITLAYQHEMRGIEAAAQRRQAAIAEQLSSISMQANIVALNARISAARAGSYGREFAVITTVLADIIKEMDALIYSVVDSDGDDAPPRRDVSRDAPRSVSPIAVPQVSARSRIAERA